MGQYTIKVMTKEMSQRINAEPLTFREANYILIYEIRVIKIYTKGRMMLFNLDSIDSLEVWDIEEIMDE